ncbi:NADH-quinone oxidoreductase subunit F [Thermotomaculum hydrothermale]|uniref:NADH-quinone oxidoreductase subunit F n=1 Tax=Thermotomaculum hydrothermale TaxID=981385 RepID=A0A7R6PFH4_9BACT|nr:NADH-quinone oxidoreductase subunit NuoF [Thermotomaculum hydrothermale]BBB32778.1 NADH-quinone oxidoreductase subunit F [Thermotomaculum hydrothermale]
MSEIVLFKHLIDPEVRNIENYIKLGGYEGLKKAFTMQPDDIIEEVKRSNLRGRGGAGFPTGLKWSFMPKGEGQKYFVCNADEGEPGTFKDRYIMSENPHQLIEGMVIGGYAMGATVGYIYIRGEFEFVAKILQKAIDEAYEKGFLGKNILNSGFDFDLYVHLGAGAYVCGEETGLINSLEGKPGQPRLKPPFPAQYGVFGKPTTVNNVETIACVPDIIKKGADWFLSIGPEKNNGTKIYAVSGHVNNPGVFELPMGTPLREIIYEHAGGIVGGKKLKAVIPGGSSAPVLGPEHLDIPMDFDSLKKVGSMLGSGAIIVMSEDTCMVEAFTRLAKFYAHESCGQCTPCREGTAWLYKILKRIEDREGKKGDIDLILDICGKIMGRTICPLGDAAVMCIKPAVERFRDEFEYHIEHKKCMVENKIPIF